MSDPVTSTSKVSLQDPRIENYILFLIPLLGAAAQFFGGTSVTFLGISPLLFSISLAALGKALVSLKDPSQYADWFLFVVTLLGLLAAGLTGLPGYAVYGVAIGFIGKAALNFKDGVNTEDVLLFVMSLLALVGQYIGSTDLVNLSLIVAAAAKALPSLGGLPVAVSIPVATAEDATAVASTPTKGRKK